MFGYSNLLPHLTLLHHSLGHIPDPFCAQLSLRARALSRVRSGVGLDKPYSY